MSFSFTGTIYLAAGIVLIGLYFQRKNRLSKLRPEVLPELDPAAYEEFRHLLASAYERMLYLAVALLVLASFYFSGSSTSLKAVFLIVVAVLFIANLTPRHKLMKILLSHGISMDRIKQAGIKL